MLRCAILSTCSILVGLAAAATAVSAETFKCPHVGGNFTFGQEANVNSLDQMTSSTISTRNIAMNMFESLMTRDENFNPILELADSMAETSDHLTYTFKLRQGIRFHNGKEMTSADVVASFDRYAKIGLYRSTLGNVARWEAPEEGAADVPGDPQRVQRADRHHSSRGQGRSVDAAQDDRHRSVATGRVGTRRVRQDETL
jgi:peptide/nickel transport system substrate-binding protein